jgi:predicted ribosomally synthesized peptide with SipW-like signal peptide
MNKIIATAINLFLLSSVLFGASLAYFTDTLTNEGNIITLGNLKVSLVAADDLSKVGANPYNLGSTNLQDLKEEFGNTSPLFDFGGRVEPGQSMSRYIRVRNSGSITMDYDLSFNVEEDFLEDYVSFSIAQVNLSTGSTLAPTTRLGTYFSNTAFAGFDLQADDYEIYRVTITISASLGNDFNFNTLSDEAFDFDVVLTANQSSESA